MGGGNPSVTLRVGLEAMLLRAGFLEFVFFWGACVGAGAAVVEEFGEPGGRAPVFATGLDDDDQRLGNGVQAGFGDLLGELLAVLEAVQDRLMVNADLRGG